MWRSIFAQAVDDGLLIRNPAVRVEPSGTPAKTRQALSAADLARLRAHITGDRLHACWLLTLYGLRRSELLALRWEDIDLTRRVVVTKCDQTILNAWPVTITVQRLRGV